MPFISGQQILQQLREQYGENAPPVIVLTAQTDQQTRMQALELGARDFLTKPFDQQEVLQRIENILQVQSLMNLQTSRATLLERLVEDRTAALQKLSSEDPLTGLPNRRALVEQLSSLADSERTFAVFFLAFDGLEDIARLHGYAVADSAMLALRDRLRQAVNDGSMAGVWNSTEWVVLIPDLTGSELEHEARRIVSLLAQAFAVEGIQFYLQLRIGISRSDQSGQVDQLIRMAALAVADDDGCWNFYSPALEQDLQRRTAYREALRHARQRGELFLLYQPKISVTDGRIRGAEALLRWNNRELGFVPPDFFIPLAESSGEILGIGDWVIDEAVRQLSRWIQQQQVDDDFHIAVNVSAVQLMQKDFAGSLIRRIHAAGLAPSRLEIEVTETGLMQDMDWAMQQLQLLADEGVTIAIDDFGTGYSSLSYLKQLPVSVLKIDRMFIRDMDSNIRDRNLAETVIQMAENFGFTTVAEGVERQEHVDILSALGCHLLQGFFYSPALAADVFLTYKQQFEQPG